MTEFINDENINIKEDTVITIGKFDGEHRGHKKIFELMRVIAKKKALKKAVFTFNTPPTQVVKGIKSDRLTTNAERRKKLEKEGIDYIIEYPFNKEVSKLDAEVFVREILISKMKMKAIVAGPDVAFGYKKSGDIKLLKRLAQELNFEVFIIDKEKDENSDISSSLIKKMLDMGNIGRANKLLGSVYSIRGKVEKGNRLGAKTLDFPTANLFPDSEKKLPRFGVYATKTRLISSGEIFFSITNVGKNPSIKQDIKKHISRIETYIYDFKKDIYGEEIEVEFYEFIRPEYRFSSLYELKSQMEKDKINVKKYFEVNKC